MPSGGCCGDAGRQGQATNRPARATRPRVFTLDCLRGQRDALQFTATSEEAVRTAEATVVTAAEQATAERGRGGCRDFCRQREEEERTARTALLQAQQNRAATIKAADLDAQITVAEAALNTFDKKAAVKEADPQSAIMAKAIGVDQIIIAALSQSFFAIAIAIEFGSGVGFWLVFGRAAQSQHREKEAPSAALVPINWSAAQELQFDEKPHDIVERFFLKVVRRALNRRVQSLAVWSAYARWCATRGIDAVSHARFGRLARWRKDRIGGAVWYLDCQLAEDCLTSARAPKALPGPGSMVRMASASTAH